jgi:CTP:molybdopterin cytidylyltransferase MocA
MKSKVGLVLMSGVERKSGPAVSLVQRARQAAALDSLAAAQAAGAYDELIVATNDRAWGAALPHGITVDLDDPNRAFHFGDRLNGLVERYRLTHVVYLGAGSAPLVPADEWRRVAEQLLLAGRLVVTNNLHSSDWAGFAPADALAPLTHRISRDNSLAWVLHREANLPAVSRPADAGYRMDIDTPTDLLVLAGDPRCNVRLANELAVQNLDTKRLDQARAVMASEGKQIIVAGRVSSATWQALEQGTLCWVRVFAEERGMVASGRQARGQARTLLGAYRELAGTTELLRLFAGWSDAVFWDNRVLLAHHGIWPPAEDRFASDLGWCDRVQEPMLRELTEAALAAPIPVILGGHSLVSGGLMALVQRVHEEMEACLSC